MSAKKKGLQIAVWLALSALLGAIARLLEAVAEIIRLLVRITLGQISQVILKSARSAAGFILKHIISQLQGNHEL